MTAMRILIQGIGFAGLVCNLLIYQQKTRTAILKTKLLSDFIWAAHYFMLGAATAGCMAVLGIFRESVFMKVDRKSPAARVWFAVFSLCSILSSILTWKGCASFLPACASILSVVSFARSEPRLTRLLCFPISLCMGSYSFLTGSAAGVVNEALSVASAAVALFRMHQRRD